jgi:CubicO group peptidase (beta-lactamase class C family)
VNSLRETVDREAARTAFAGVVRVDRGQAVEVEAAYGLADRAHGIAMTPEHQLGTASVTKGFTALAVLGLIADGALSLSTPARSVLGADLPLIDDGVTVEHLLSHRSGIGDYVDETMLTSSDDYVMPVPVHTLVSTEDYLAVLDRHPQASPPGREFVYNNGAFVVLALIAERVAGMPFADLVAARVWEPAGMVGTAFLRSDELPGIAAVGYLHADGLRSNVLHLPVRGSGDGGAYTTAADMRAFWLALLGGRIIPERWLAEMLVPRELPTPDSLGYGLGIWLLDGGALELHGYDAGVSYRSIHDPASGSTWTVGATTNEGSGPIERVLVADLRQPAGEEA